MIKNNLKFLILEKKEKGKNICKIYFDNKVFKGSSTCRKEDICHYSSLLGAQIAHMRAYIKLLDYLSNDIPEYEQEKQQLLININSIIDNFYLTKKRVENFKKRKEKGYSNAREEFKQKIDDLLKMKK